MRLGLQAHGAQRLQDLGIELGIPIQNRKSVRDRVAKCLAQLLHYPVRSRARRHAEMQNPAPTMFDHEQAVQHSEAQGGHGEEVQRHDGLAVIPQEGPPALSRITAPLKHSEVPRDGSLREHEAKFQKLTVNLGSSPASIFLRHPLNQFTDFESEPVPATCGSARTPAPIQPESGAMPSDHCLRLHDQQHFGPARPELPQHGPEQTVHAIQFWTGPFAFQHGYLLAQGENLQRQIGSECNEDAYNGHNIENEGKHDVEFYHNGGSSVAQLANL